MNLNVSMNDLLVLLGQNAVELAVLRARVAELEAQLQRNQPTQTLANGTFHPEPEHAHAE